MYCTYGILYLSPPPPLDGELSRFLPSIGKKEFSHAELCAERGTTSAPYQASGRLWRLYNPSASSPLIWLLTFKYTARSRLLDDSDAYPVTF